jgi:ABC-type multidrug transport system ATPase subunit
VTLVDVEGLTAAAAPVGVRAVSFTLDAGAHALVGTPEDGPPLVLAVLAGRVKPRAGRVRVLDAAPPFAAARRAMAYVPMAPSLPDALCVDEALALASSIRGDSASAPEERLGELDLASLLTRRVKSLTREEGRALAMAEALTSPAVRAILLEEPLVATDPRLAARLPAALRAASERGVVTVLSTASPRDAGSLAESLLLFDRGVLVRRAAHLDAVAATPAKGARMRVVASSPRALLAALANEAAVTKLETEGRAVVVHGDLLPDLAAAVGRATLRANVELVEMRADVPTLEELRAANAGVRDAYAAAQALAAIAAGIGHRMGSANAASHVLVWPFGAIALPLFVYAVVSATLGGEGVARASRSLVAFGADPARAALSQILVAVVTSALLSAVVGSAVAALAHGSADPPPLRDALTSAWIAALGGAAYASLFAFGSTFGARGAGRTAALVLDWALGAGGSGAALVTPRAHLRNLMGGAAPVEIGQRASVAWLAALAIAFILLAVARARRAR